MAITVIKTFDINKIVRDITKVYDSPDDKVENIWYNIACGNYLFILNTDIY